MLVDTQYIDEADRLVTICAKITRSILAIDELHRDKGHNWTVSFFSSAIGNPSLGRISVQCRVSLCCRIVISCGFTEIHSSDDGPLGGGQVDGLDADSQGFLQVLEDVTAGAVGRCVVQQLLERLQLDEDHHVFQEVAHYVGR